MMRSFSSLLFSAAVIYAQVSTPVDTASAPPAQPKARLEGHVLSQTTGEPLRKANLHLAMLQRLGVGPANSQMPRYVVSSDAGGKFAFEDVEAGRYSLSADRAGYVRQNYGARAANSGGTNLTLDSGQEIKGIVLKLVPQGVISGRVVDEDGDPMGSGFVELYR